MRITSTLVVTLLAALPVMAANSEAASEASAEGEFKSEERLEEGFITKYANQAIAQVVSSQSETAGKGGSGIKYGRNVSGFASAPKFGGYVIGKYSYTDKTGSNSGDGFNARLIRMYVSGSILNDFKYRVQVELNNTPHVKDYQIEWAKYSEFSVKMGQFKRPFTFENPYNPWDIGIGDYSQLTKKLAGMSDYNGEPSNGGRDQGLQVQGELLKVGKDRHNLLQYQLGVFNGQGINSKDANSQKDIIGNIKVQPLKGWLIGLFGWHGNYTASGVTVDRNRWAVGSTYENNGWVARAEYAHSQGYKISDIHADGTVAGTGRADAWYAMAGVPCNDWLSCFARYDAYRDQATWGSTKTIYSLCPNFRLNKNLLFQVQYNYVCDRTSTVDSKYNEVWFEAYIRF